MSQPAHAQKGVRPDLMTALGLGKGAPVAEDQDEAEVAARSRAGRRPAEKGSASRPGGRKAPAPPRKAAPAPPPEPSETATSTSATTPAADPVVRTPTTTEAKRVGLYLDADDYRDLVMAKLDDGADLNARIRAMIAVWREQPRFRTAVNKLASQAPRGPYR